MWLLLDRVTHPIIGADIDAGACIAICRCVWKNNDDGSECEFSMLSSDSGGHDDGGVCELDVALCSTPLRVHNSARFDPDLVFPLPHVDVVGREDKDEWYGEVCIACEIEEGLRGRMGE